MRCQLVALSIPISDLLKIPLILGMDLDRNGRAVVYSSNETGIPHLYILPTKAGSKPRRITSGDDPVLMGMLSPDGDDLVYSLDKDGNELHHLYLISKDGGEPERITEEPYRTFGCDWHPSGKEVTRAFASMSSCGLESIDLETGENFKLKEPTPPILELEYSHDGNWIACSMMAGLKNMQIFIVNRNDPSDTIVYSLKEDSKEGAPSWSIDDSKLAFQSDAMCSNRIVIQEFQGDERLILDLEEEEEAVGPQPVWAPKGDKVYYIVSKQSRTTAHAHPLDGKKESALPFPRGTIESLKISRDGQSMVAVHSSMTSPPGIYLHNIGTESSTPLTPQDHNIDLSKLVEPQSVWYESFDGRKIHSWYLPAAKATRKTAVLYPHGGPTGQVFDEWMQGAFFQYFSQSGFAVLAPNFRGSTGYGAEFRDLNIGDLGGGDLEDVVYGAEWLSKQEGVDGSKISIMGASYGGFMTLMALTKKPDVFAVGVSLVPVVDWLEMYDLSDRSYRMFMEMLLGGPPSEKEEVYMRCSPSNYVDNIKSPVLIVAGKNDSRCPLRPIEKFVNRLEEMNHSYEFVIEERAGHITDIVKSEKRIITLSRSIDYLNRVLA